MHGSSKHRNMLPFLMAFAAAATAMHWVRSVICGGGWASSGWPTATTKNASELTMANKGNCHMRGGGGVADFPPFSTHSQLWCRLWLVGYSVKMYFGIKLVHLNSWQALGGTGRFLFAMVTVMMELRMNGSRRPQLVNVLPCSGSFEVFVRFSRAAPFSVHCSNQAERYFCWQIHLTCMYKTS